MDSKSALKLPLAESLILFSPDELEAIRSHRIVIADGGGA